MLNFLISARFMPCAQVIAGVSFLVPITLKSFYYIQNFLNYLSFVLKLCVYTFTMNSYSKFASHASFGNNNIISRILFYPLNPSFSLLFATTPIVPQINKAMHLTRKSANAKSFYICSLFAVRAGDCRR